MDSTRLKPTSPLFAGRTFLYLCRFSAIVSHGGFEGHGNMRWRCTDAICHERLRSFCISPIVAPVATKPR